MAENEWTDELKEQVAEAYLAANPTAENTMDIVKEIAQDVGKTPNGVRIILTKAGVYVKKEIAKAATSSGTTASKRVNKAEAIDALKVTIVKRGNEVDADIVDRLTGKAAVYFNGLLEV
jgi:predicted transcriptional regulator